MNLLKRFALSAGVATSASCLCIARGTRIRTATGQREIESLEIGSAVLCVDPSSGETVEALVTAVRMSRRECVSLVGAQFSLTCTTDHPLYDPQEGRYADAGDWVLGRRTTLLLTEPLAHARVVSTSDAGVHDVFDLTVDHPLHNFVANGVLVHNKSPPCFDRPAEARECRCPPETSARLVCTHEWSGPDRCECRSPDGGVVDGVDGGVEGVDGGP